MRTLLAVLLALAACSSPPPIQTPMCTTGQTVCGSECADLKTSASHCGACGTACTATQSCVVGSCFDNTCNGTTCAASQICMSGHCAERACVDVMCPAGQGCLGGSCVSTSCGAMACPSGQLCVNGSCADAACFGVICPANQSCSLGVCSDTHCSDGMTDNGETDVDCGGTCPAKCKTNMGCTAGTDCTSGTCTAGHCAASATCSDGKRDGTETDIDCGGPDCALRCSVGSGCLADADCTSGTCSGSVCAAPSCSDGKKNGTETDVDCGGVCTLKCADGQHCGVPTDCTSMTCVASVCTTASCADGTKNGSETDVDCGGSCPLKCSVNQHCAVPADCTSMNCMAGTCAGASCFDNAKNGTESDVDCGGSCAKKCTNGQHCNVPQDCSSVSCVGGLCTGSSCTDMVLNGSETDVDCGGSCSPCADGLHCLAPADCTSDVCTSGVCQVPSCTDLVKNGSETDTDCGGTCATKCADGKMCISGNDCVDRVCSGMVCTGPTCFDGVRNGTETDIDCGGSCARKCLSGQSCAMPGDCASGICQGMTCGADPLNSGLMGYWTMNAADITGTAVTDSSGNGNMAILEGTFASSVGKVGEALQFIGGNSYVNVGDGINLTAAVTMSAWVKTTVSGAQQNIVNKWCTMGQGCGDPNQAYFMDVTAAGAAQCYVNGTNNADYNISGGMVADNNWHLVTCTIDRAMAGSNFVLYVDGAQVASAVLAGNVIHASLDPTLIGGNFYGYLDDVRIYNRALSAGEVLSLSSMTYPAVPQPPSSLAASTVSSSEIDLSWVRSPSGGITGYVVERSLTGAGNWFPVAVVGGAATTFADATLPAGLKFYYRVSAQTPSGTSTPTATANATTLTGATTYAVPAGLIGYWTGNAADIMGTQETDGSGSGNTAAVVGGLTTAPGKIREALQSTVGQRLTVSTLANPALAVTMSAWINTTQTSTADPFDKWCTSGSCGDANQSFFMAINNTANSGLVTCYFNGTNNADYNISGRIPINDGQWHHVVCTGDAAGTGNNIKVYVDGELDADAYVGTNILHTTLDPLYLSQSFVGLIDDLRLYNRALTTAEIRTLFNNGSMGSP